MSADHHQPPVQMELAQADLRIDYKIMCGNDPSDGNDRDAVWMEDSLVTGDETNSSEPKASKLNEESNRQSRSDIFTKNAKNTENIYNVAAVVIPTELLELSLSVKKETEDFDANSTHTSQKNHSETFSTEKGILKDGSSLRKLAKCQAKENETQSRLSQKSSDRVQEIYYETPEKRRKRLDNEAARKREYRMYNETTEERRKRLDREAERRRLKRLMICANETPEERRERLNRESSRRRESRLNQYANESEEDRQLRLEKDATRAREMRFTRSAIESDEERRVRLLKDTLRKRELRMQHGDVELRTMMNFDEFNNVVPKEQQELQQQDNHFTGHCVGNWTMWFQNTIGETGNNTDKNCQTQTDA